MSPACSSGSPELFIPQPAVFKENITGRRPKLLVNDRFKARGWSSFQDKSCIVTQVMIGQTNNQISDSLSSYNFQIPESPSRQNINLVRITRHRRWPRRDISLPFLWIEKLTNCHGNCWWRSTWNTLITKLSTVMYKTQYSWNITFNKTKNKRFE